MNTRALSAKIVSAVYNGKSLSDAFDLHLPKNKDAAFIKTLCFGTIRFYHELHAILSTLLDKPLKPKDNDIECLLLIGLYQLLHLDTPHYAAINESVSATKILKKRWATGLTNKILRLSLSIDKEKLLASKIDAQYAHPLWMIKKIKADWPNHWQSILNANNIQAPLFLRVNQTKIPTNDYIALLEKAGIEHKLPPKLPFAVEITSPIPTEKLPGFKEGFFSVQDLTGQKVTEYLNLGTKQSVLDACCAPGSKTTHMLETRPDIRLITAVDISAKRLQKLTDNLKRLQLPTKKVKIIAGDMDNIDTWWDKTHYDRILVDAPCSATGVIRRHPDIKLLRKLSDIAVLARQQRAILDNAWQMLSTGGVLVYTTCSVFSDENEQIIELFLQNNKDAVIQSLDESWGINLSFGQQVLPGDQARDGFYYAAIKKQTP